MVERLLCSSAGLAAVPDARLGAQRPRLWRGGMARQQRLRPEPPRCSPNTHPVGRLLQEREQEGAQHLPVTGVPVQPSERHSYCTTFFATVGIANGHLKVFS